jgi:hypothetical protein
MPKTAARNPNAIDELSQYLLSGTNALVIGVWIASIGAWADRKGIARSHAWPGEFETIWRRRDGDTDLLRLGQLRCLAAVTAAAREQRFAYSIWPLWRPGVYNHDAATWFVRHEFLHAIDWTAR